MVKIKFLIIILFLYLTNIQGQTGIGTLTPDPSAALDITSSDSGLLLTRVSLLSTEDTATIVDPANGLVVFNIASNGSGDTAVNANSFYYWDASAVRWKFLINREDLSLIHI